MKYTIEGFSQEVALSYHKKITDAKGKTKDMQLDCTDLVILRWFVDFFPNMEHKIIDNKEYGWVTAKKLQDDLPILRLNKRDSLLDRLRKLEILDILESAVDEGKGKKSTGKRKYYTFGPNYINLITSDNNAEKIDNFQASQGTPVQPGVGIPVQSGVGTPVQPAEDNSIKDKSINNIISIVDSTDYEKEFNEEIWPIYPKKVGKKLSLKHYVAARKHGMPKESVIIKIEEYKKYLEATNKSIQYTKNGSTFFNNLDDEYEVPASSDRCKCPLPSDAQKASGMAKGWTYI